MPRILLPSQVPTLRALVPFLPWICVIAVALSIKYGYYGDHKITTSPNSSQLIVLRSVLIKQIQVKGGSNQGLLLYEFKEIPLLSVETKFTVSNRYLIDIYAQKGFRMWLNKGSRIQVYLDLERGNHKYRNMLIVLIKGKKNAEEPHQFYRFNGSKTMEYTVQDHDSYYFGVVNLSPRIIITKMKIKITSKIYNTRNATRICSTNIEPCRINISFPSTRYFVLTTTNDNINNTNVTNDELNVEILFIARLIAYLLITGFVGLVIYYILKNLGVCNSESSPVQLENPVTNHRETEPILPTKDICCNYGSTEQTAESSFCSSSDDLYDGKICIICYDKLRDCFFIPCGHSATCFSCGQRIMEEENKVCPICRRLIHKLRRLINP